MATARPRTRFIVLRGIDAGRLSALAAEIMALLPGRAARLPLESFHSAWLTDGGSQGQPDIGLGYRIGKLVAVSYIREGYHVLLEDAETGNPDQAEQLAEIIALVRTLTVDVTVVDCSPPARTTQSVVAGDFHISALDAPESAARAIMAQLPILPL